MYKKYLKRFIDLLLSFLAIAALSPIFLIISIIIFLFDNGPIFFVQDRVGKNGSTFKFYKFRTMPVDSPQLPSDQIKKIEIGMIGRILRRTNLDEIPQLINIIAGQMSIVGPRPCLPEQEELITLRKANGSIACRPGLTGMAQVNSYDGMPISIKAEFDKHYSCNVTFFNDIKIIFKTLVYLTKEPPKY